VADGGVLFAARAARADRGLALSCREYGALGEEGDAGGSVKKVKESNGRIAAFFDLDGTLVARPSLEWRFFQMLRYRGAFPVGNYFLWLREAARLAPRGICAMRYANKMYLRGVALDAMNRRTGGISFFAGAVDLVAWHAKQRHKIVIVSGTLETLAREAATQLEAKLEARGLAAEIHVCATRLEEREGKWTGRVIGAAMYGEAKADAVRRMAEEEGFDLTKCYAYGNSAMDRWMLAAVRRPVVVNPSKELLRKAQRRNWPTLLWEKHRKEESTQSTRRTQRTSGKQEVAGLEMDA
jgi:HAD superfamily hydrolase (TIGR01490 family)